MCVNMHRLKVCYTFMYNCSVYRFFLWRWSSMHKKPKFSCRKKITVKFEKIAKMKIANRYLNSKLIIMLCVSYFAVWVLFAFTATLNQNKTLKLIALMWQYRMCWFLVFDTDLLIMFEIDSISLQTRWSIQH